MNEADWTELERAASAGMRGVPEPSLGTLWFSMRGRIPRSTYWLKFCLPVFVLQFAGAMGDLLAGTMSPEGVGPFSVVVWLGVLYPCLVGSVKRLHDLGHPGWYLAVFYGGMFGAGIVSAIAAPLLGAGVAMLLLIPALFLALASIWYTVRIAFGKGTAGSNRYGPDPRRRVGAPAYG